MKNTLTFKKFMSSFLSLIIILSIPILTYASEDKNIFKLFYKDIKTIVIRNGSTGRVIYLDNEDDIQNAVTCLNNFYYDSKSPESNTVGYQYMLWIESKEGNVHGTVPSYQFTANSIWVDGEKLVSNEPLLSKLIDFLPKDANYLFDDVSSDDRCYNDVKYVVENKIFYGISDLLFDPDASLNRGMAVTTIHRLAGCPESQKNPMFCDVQIGSWYSNAIQWAAGNQIVSGIGSNTFLPNSLVTREQLSAMMYRYIQHEYNASAIGDLSRYSDGENVSSWAKESMEWAVRSGIIKCKIDTISKTESVLDPQGKVSRADAAGMLRRLNEYIDKLQATI